MPQVLYETIADCTIPCHGGAMSVADLWDVALNVDEYISSMTQNQGVFAAAIGATELTDQQRRLFAGDPARILVSVSYTHLPAHATVLDIVCRLLLDKK